MKTLLVGFGDSWTFGSELDRPQEQSWVVQLADMLGAEHLNLGVPASSIEHTIVKLFDFIDDFPQYAEYKKIFAVGLSGTTRHLSYSNQLKEYVSITPEANYRTGNIHQSGKPPSVIPHFNTLSGEMYRMVDCKQYSQFKVRQTMFTFENYCQQNNIDLVFFSYFDYPNVASDLLYHESLTKALTGRDYEPTIKQHEYFVGNLFHPNIKGHTRMAEIIKEFYDQKYPRH